MEKYNLKEEVKKILSLTLDDMSKIYTDPKDYICLSYFMHRAAEVINAEIDRNDN